MNTAHFYYIINTFGLEKLTAGNTICIIPDIQHANSETLYVEQTTGEGYIILYSTPYSIEWLFTGFKSRDHAEQILDHIKETEILFI